MVWKCKAKTVQSASPVIEITAARMAMVSAKEDRSGPPMAGWFCLAHEPVKVYQNNMHAAYAALPSLYLQLERQRQAS